MNIVNTGTVLLKSRGMKHKIGRDSFSDRRMNGGDLMFSHNGKISTRQVLILLVLQMFNMNILVVPRLATNYIGRNGYALPVVAIILGSIYVYCITALTMKFPNKTFVEIVKEIFPNGIAYILAALFAIKLLIGTGLELRMFGELILQVMLPRTPLAVIMLVLLLSASYLVKSGAEATARMGEVLIYFIFIPLAITLITIALKVDYAELLPFFQTNVKDFGIGIIAISYLFIPLEFLLMITGLMKRPQRVRKIGISAVCIIGILTSLITLFTLAEIGPVETQRQVWPVLALMQSIGLNNSVVENQEVLLLFIWILSVFMCIASGLYFSSLIGSRSFQFKRENVFVLPFVPIVFFVAIWPKNLVAAYEYYLKFQYYFGIWFVVIIPLILLIIARVRGLGYEK